MLIVEVNTQACIYKFTNVNFFACSNKDGDIILLYNNCMNQHFFSPSTKIYIMHTKDKKDCFDVVYVNYGCVSVSNNVIQFNALKANINSPIECKPQPKLTTNDWLKFKKNLIEDSVQTKWIENIPFKCKL